jgi:hypothetical protein
MRGERSREQRLRMRWPTATPEEVAAEPAPFPSKTVAEPVETFFLDWRRRLNRNLSRRSDSRWDPLTRVHAVVDLHTSNKSNAMPSRPFAEYRDTPLWSAVEATIAELAATNEVSVNTAPDYVVGYLCGELVAKRLIVPTGFQR